MVLCLGMAGCTDWIPGQSGSTSPPHGRAALLAESASAIRTSVSVEGGVGAASPGERAQLTALYGLESYAPLWVGPSGRPTANARDALRLLEDAPDQGLDATQYDAPRLDGLASTLDADRTPTARDVAAFDVDLSLNTLRFFHDVHLGRVDPRTLGLEALPPREPPDFVSLLHSAIADHRVLVTAADLEPQVGLYRALAAALPHYRDLAARTDLGIVPAGPTVHPGDRDASVNVLSRRLVALGDWPDNAAAPAPSDVYAEAVVDAVRHFQTRHGLDPDGILGPTTVAALDVPLTWRVRQIELSLERLRWLPPFTENRLVLVNIPAFRLSAWNAVPPVTPPVLSMSVIVGRALETETPVFTADMRYLIFRPYWNVPMSIVRKEILPSVAKDPGYLDHENMEIVWGQSDDAQAVPETKANLDLLRRGLLRLRQRPGSANALGLVKFMFPNEEAIYLHGTPAAELFARARRDFSHGCVRVEDPVALAEWVLADPATWPRQAIVDAMHGTDTRRVDLAHSVQVILFYLTATVAPEDGTVRFANDIYDRDARLDAALRRAR
jgi:L,D-transpeptidase YcbB